MTSALVASVEVSWSSRSGVELIVYCYALIVCCYTLIVCRTSSHIYLVVQYLNLAVYVVYGEWVDLSIVSALHLVL